MPPNRIMKALTINKILREFTIAFALAGFIFFNENCNLPGHKPALTTSFKADTVYLWEDDYYQIEIIPEENLESIEKQTDTISDFSNEHRTAYGFTDVYVRTENPVLTKSKHIAVDDLELVFIAAGQVRAPDIRFQSGEIVNFNSGQTRAFGTKSFAIFYDFKEKNIENIWLSTNFIKDPVELEKAVITLTSLGKKFRLILVDWNSFEIVDLKDSGQVRAYFAGHGSKK